MEFTLEQMMALEMELCTLLLETLDINLLGPPKMQEGEEEEGLHALEWGWQVCKTGLKKKGKKKGHFFKNPGKMKLLQVVGQPKVGGRIALHPKWDQCSHGGWFIQAMHQWVLVHYG